MKVSPKKPSETYGFLANIKLGQLAGYDSSLTPAAHRAMLILLGYADAEGTLWPSMGKCGAQLGISGEAFSKSVRQLRDRGYLKTTPRYNLETKARQPNLIQLNHEMVRLYSDDLSVFAKAAINSALATSTGCKGGNSNEVLGVTTAGVDKVLTPESSIKKAKKKTFKEKIEEIVKERVAKDYNKRQILKSRFWLQEKEYEAVTGITKEMKENLDNLIREVTKDMSLNERNNLSFEAKRAAKDVPKEQKLQTYYDVYYKHKSSS